MTKTRPIPKIDLKQYAEPGYIYIKPIPESNEVSLTLHHCTVYLNETEALATILSLVKAATAMWGDWFQIKVSLLFEKL